MDKSSRLPGFYKLSLEERVALVGEWAGLTGEERAVLERGLGPAQADRMIENVVGTCALPLGIAVNFLINGRDYLIPMAIEEPSVVAGASYAAKLVRQGGGFVAESTEPLMIGQVQVLGVADLKRAAQAVLEAREDIFALADAQHPTIVRLGGGAKGLEVRELTDTPVGPMLVLHLLYDTRDAMGANAVNTACEALETIKPSRSRSPMSRTRWSCSGSNEVKKTCPSIRWARTTSTAVCSTPSCFSSHRSVTLPFVVSSTSSSVGTRSPSPASRLRISRKLRRATSPVPFVVRSTLGSCMITGCPSAVSCTSHSTKSHPSPMAYSNPLIVFSGSTPAAPR